MSDTGFPRFTAAHPPNLSRDSGDAALPEPNARIISAPEDVRENVRTLRQSLRLRGEVIREDKDNSVRVRTARGDIDVRLGKTQGQTHKTVERGAQVELDIQPSDKAGRQPERVTIKIITPALQNRERSAPVEIDVRAHTGGATRQPDDGTTQASSRIQPSSRPAQGLPPEGSLVRLTPLPPTASTQNVTLGTINQSIKFSTYITEFTDKLPLPPFPLLTSPQNITAPTPLSLQANLNAPKKAPSAAFSTPFAATAGALEQGTLGAMPSSSAPPKVVATGRPRAAHLDVRIHKILAPEPLLSAPTPTPTGAPTTTLAGAPKPGALILENQQAGSLGGIVTGITAGNLPTVSLFFPQSGDSLQFALQAPSTDITIGAKIQVMPHTQTPNLQSAAAPNLPLPALLAPQPWALMEDIQAHLDQHAPKAAVTMRAMIPSPAMPAQFGPAALFFIAAVRGGDIGQWMGEKTMEALSKSGKGLLGRLTQEGQALSRAANEPASQDWRAVNFPLLWDGQIQKIALYYKHEQAQSDTAQESAKGTRFVFDLALDRMGNVQIDGLYRPVSQDGKRLDIMVRTQEIFSEATRTEMRGVYARALRHTDVGGELSFQNNPDQWVSIQADKQATVGVSA